MEHGKARGDVESGIPGDKNNGRNYTITAAQSFCVERFPPDPPFNAKRQKLLEWLAFCASNSNKQTAGGAPHI